jgi:SAM-dependent methyltransferase
MNKSKHLFLPDCKLMPTQRNWYETWFNTPYCDMLYKHRDGEEAARFIDALINYLNPKLLARILDVACGKGRHAMHLAAEGFDVTGIDLSFKHIRDARIYEHKHLAFFQHDMRHIFRVNYFDYVFNFFTSFGYFENMHDNLRALNSLAAALKKGGIIVIDFLNVNHVLQHLKDDESKTIEGVKFNMRKNYENGFIVNEILVTDGTKETIFYEKVKAIDKTEFEKYFAQAALKIITVFGDYALHPFDEETSERLILIAEK